MTREAIPQLWPLTEPRTETMQYADVPRRFGAPHARPATGDALAIGRVADWSPMQVLEAAIAGARDPNALEDADIARVCLAFVELAEQRDAAILAHAQVSAENIVLRHRLAGTTSAAETIAQSRTDTLNDRVRWHHESDDDAETEVVDIPLPERTAL